MNDTTPPATQSEAGSQEAKPTFICDCGQWTRLACQGEPFFREHEGKRYCVLHCPGADKADAFRVAFKRKLEAKDFDFRSVWFPESVDFIGFEFSADANFGSATFSADANFGSATFGADANFGRATFHADANFGSATFGADAYFGSTTFSTDVDFGETTFSAFADFSSATFSAVAYFGETTFSADANFGSATFSAVADFNHTTFSANVYFSSVMFGADAYFDSATFGADAYFGSAMFHTVAYFSSATFSTDADFNHATFSADADFSSAVFKSYVNFAGSNEQRNFGKQARLDFQFTHIEEPDRVSFHTLDLKPHWLINCDCRKFEFVDCDWNYNLKQELEGATKAEISAPHRLLAITFRQLADNAEANHRYHEASNFRYNAFEARRVEKFSGFVPWRLDWWYWLASGYGERVGRAFVVFIVLFALFAFGYTWTGFDQSGKAAIVSVPLAASQPDTIGKPLDWQDAFIYSFYVTILQKPKPEPLTRAAKILVGLETVLGPAQAALLALAVRRRFMR